MYLQFTANIIVVCCTIIFVSIFFLKRNRQSQTWKATVTPLASIIGSGFLVVAPLYIMILGEYAVFATIGMVIFAYLMGYVMRFNIKNVESLLSYPASQKIIYKLEHLSFFLLGAAYLVSIPFYIKLLSLFVLKGFNAKSEFIANCITTVILGGIGIVGKFKGFKQLEFMEEYSVNIKLSIIFSMIIALIIFNINLIDTHAWKTAFTIPVFDFETLRKLLGTIIIVQGFETSRFLGLAYNAKLRITTIRYAQIISGIIYIAFSALSLVVFNTIKTMDETSIIDISGKIASILPGFLIVAAVLSQFSASIADTISAGGLFSEAMARRLKVNDIYLTIAIGAIALTWFTNIFEIISIASRAFALYYALQAFEAILVSYQKGNSFIVKLRVTLFLFVFLVMLMIVFWGIPL